MLDKYHYQHLGQWDEALLEASLIRQCRPKSMHRLCSLLYLKRKEAKQMKAVKLKKQQLPWINRRDLSMRFIVNIGVIASSKFFISYKSLEINVMKIEDAFYFYYNSRMYR